MARILNANTDVTLGGVNASNEVISSQKAIKTYVDNKKYIAQCPAITPVEGVANWTVTHNLGTPYVICALYDSNGSEIVKNVTIVSANQILVSFNADSSVSAEDYSVVVLS